MSTTLEALTEEEAYLWAILEDRAGIDQAEFLWPEPSSPDGVFRCRPYQWPWYRCDDPLQVELSSRSVGKSLGISLRGFAHFFVNPGQEMLVTAPELIHLEPVVNLIEHRLLSTRLSRELMPKGRSTITHRPFMAVSANGARILGRIPQRDGRGVKGVHPLWLELDESQDFPDKGYVELIETLKRGVPGAMWRAHGVTNGVGGFFYEITKGAETTAPLRQTAKKDPEDWTIHRLVAMLREDWTDEERAEKIRQYGSKESPDYQRNVLGQHGPAQNVIFVLSRLMKCADDDVSSHYNTEEYFHVTVRDTDLARPGADIVDFLDFPASLTSHKAVWVGMDVGFVNDPSEILIFGEEHVDVNSAERKRLEGRSKAIPSPGNSRLKLLARVSLHRVPEPAQTEAILTIIDAFRPQAFGMDKSGNGLPLYQEVQNRLKNVYDEVGTARAKRALEAIKGYGFSEKILVDLDQAVDVREDAPVAEQAKEAGIYRMVLEVSTDCLRTLVDTERLWLPWDRDLLNQFNGQTFSYSKATRDAYGRRRIFSQGNFHALDAARMAALAHKQFAIEALMATKEPETGPVVDVFVAM